MAHLDLFIFALVGGIRIDVISMDAAVARHRIFSWFSRNLGRTSPELTCACGIGGPTPWYIGEHLLGIGVEDVDHHLETTWEGVQLIGRIPLELGTLNVLYTLYSLGMPKLY